MGFLVMPVQDGREQSHAQSHPKHGCTTRAIVRESPSTVQAAWTAFDAAHKARKKTQHNAQKEEKTAWRHNNGELMSHAKQAPNGATSSSRRDRPHHDTTRARLSLVFLDSAIRQGRRFCQGRSRAVLPSKCTCHHTLLTPEEASPSGFGRYAHPAQLLTM